MSFFQIITLILLSGQVSAAPSLIGAGQGTDGWRMRDDGSLDYIIKFTPETIQKLSSGEQEATFQIPEYALLSMKSITVQVGTTPAERTPSQQSLEKQYEDYKKESAAGVGVNNLSGTTSDPNDKIRNIDPERSGKSNMRSVAQTGATPFTTPPVSSYGSTTGQISGTASTNPALGGTSPTFGGNPALGYQDGASSGFQRPSQPTYTSPSPYSGPSSGLSTDPASLTNPNSYYSSSGSTLQPITSGQPSAYPNQVPVSTRDQFSSGSGSSLQISNGPQQPTTGIYQPQSNYNNTGRSTTPYPGTSNQFRQNELSNYGSGPSYDSRFEGQRRRQDPDYMLADASGSLRNETPVSYQDQKDEELLRLRAFKAQVEGGQSSLVAVTKESKTIADLERDKLLFQVVCIVLLVVCCFLTAWLMRLANSYRSLHASSRHSINLGS